MYKRYRQNHNFQIDNFLIGQCHTPDSAYYLILDQIDDREMALHEAEYNNAKHLRKNKWIWLKRLLGLWHKEDDIKLQRDTEFSKKLVQAAQEELAHLQKRASELKEFVTRDPQETQRDEWRLEFLHRIENELITTGHVSTETMRVSRSHPDFIEKMLPEIQNKLRLNGTEGGTIELLTANKNNLLENKQDVDK